MKLGKWVVWTGSVAVLMLAPAPRVVLADSNDQVQAASRTATAFAKATADAANFCAQGAARGDPCTATPTATPTLTPVPSRTPVPPPSATPTNVPVAEPTLLPALPVPGASEALAAYVRPTSRDPSLVWLELAVPQGRWLVRYDAALCAAPSPWTNVWLALEQNSNRPITVEMDSGALCAFAQWQWESDAPCAMSEDAVCDAVADPEAEWPPAAAEPPPAEPTARPTPPLALVPVRPAPPPPAPQVITQYIYVPVEPSPQPTATEYVWPTSTPTATPTSTLTATPTSTATRTPTVAPTFTPVPEPTAGPTPQPAASGSGFSLPSLPNPWELLVGLLHWQVVAPTERAYLTSPDLPSPTVLLLGLLFGREPTLPPDGTRPRELAPAGALALAWSPRSARELKAWID